MDGQEYKFHVGARVRLKANVDPSIYGDYACIGNEGIIADIRKDRFDLPEVRIQWDKNHWAHNGIEDCWTFEDHFELVGDHMASKKDKVDNILATFAQGLKAVLDDEEETKPAASISNRFLEAAQGMQAEPTHDDQFGQAVAAASAKLAESEAFIIIGIDRHNHPQAPDGILEPYAMGYSRTPEGDLLTTAHMASVAAKAHQHLALEAITQLAVDES